MNILIFGASGATGHHLVKQALAQGHYVTAFLRQNSKLDLEDARLKIIRGDINNLQHVSVALEGQKAVISALGASSPFRYDQSVVDGLKLIMKAMETRGVHRFVYLSFLGVRDSRKQAGLVVRFIAPIVLATEIRGHETREKIIVESDLGWTIVRPPTLTNGKHLGRYRSGDNIQSKKFAATISRADVADFMLSQLSTDQYLFSKPAVMY
jgi:putative NADH-flavin reductase